MAINVDTVYKTVLLIINKEQRGYLTPNEFNRIATQVQLETIDEYFQTIYQQSRFSQNESEYGDRYLNVQQKLDIFKKIGDCAYDGSGLTKIFTPPSSSGSATGTQTYTYQTTSPLTTSYALTTITQSDVENSNVVVTLNGQLFSTSDYNITGGFFNLTTINITDGDVILITIYPKDFYKLGTVIFDGDKEVERVERNQLAKLNLSTLTKPSTYYPVYLYENNNIIIYPQSISSSVQATYIKKPANVMWNFTSSTGHYVWDPNSSVDFELDPTEQTSVILKILLYAGVVIKDPTIIDVAAREVAAEKANERN
jgi:hypothetical protein